MRRAELVASLTEPPTPDALAALPPEVGWLEVRDDLVGDLDVEDLRRRFRGRLLFTLRSVEEGGRWKGSSERRRERLAWAAERYDLVDLEGERDLCHELLARLDPERRLLSWHGPALVLAELEARWERLAGTPARLYKLIPTATRSGEEMVPLRLLHHLRRDDVVAFAAGAVGAWTRLAAPRLGAAWVYGAAGDSPAAPGQLAVSRLVADYGLPALPPVEKLYGVVGSPVLHSLSPRLYNAAFRELGLACLYVPFHAERFGSFWLEVVEDPGLAEMGLALGGLSVTTPHKGAALAVAGAASPLAEMVGAVNTLVPREGVWEGENTDAQGAVVALRQRGVDPTGRSVAVVGAGRAGRAVAVGLRKAGGRVILFNRNVERGRQVAQELHLPFQPLAELAVSEFEVLIQATSLGRRPDDPLPFSLEGVAPGTVLVDLVYGEGETPLVASARAGQLVVVDGREALLGQAVDQFRLMTGHELPWPLGRRVLEVES